MKLNLPKTPSSVTALLRAHTTSNKTGKGLLGVFWGYSHYRARQGQPSEHPAAGGQDTPKTIPGLRLVLPSCIFGGEVRISPRTNPWVTPQHTTTLPWGLDGADGRTAGLGGSSAAGQAWRCPEPAPSAHIPALLRVSFMVFRLSPTSALGLAQGSREEGGSSSWDLPPPMAFTRQISKRKATSPVSRVNIVMPITPIPHQGQLPG